MISAGFRIDKKNRNLLCYDITSIASLACAVYHRLLRKQVPSISIDNHFELIRSAPDSAARLGQMVTSHGTVTTPVFMPVGTQATVKAVTPQMLRDAGIKMILSNTYHLYLRPGVEIIRKLDGLHRFMDWDGAILTDSGGFQIFSLARLREVNEEGVKFRSHIDGGEHFLTPELVILLQEELGADVAMVLDICPSFLDSPETVKEATERTHRWAERCLKSHSRADQALFAIVQGGFSPEFRQDSARILSSMHFPGYAIGGLSLGEPKELTYQIIDITVPLLPADRPRYLMGVGSPDDILNGVARGIDLFDSVLPTRIARNGGIFTAGGRINIRNAEWKDRESPVDPNCKCYACRHFSAAYLHHLFRAEELLAYTLATVHNLTFMQNFMEQIRESIARGTFNAYREDFLAGYRVPDEKVRLVQKRKWQEKWDWNSKYSIS